MRVALALAAGLLLVCAAPAPAQDFRRVADPKATFAALVTDKACRSTVSDAGRGDISVVFQCQREAAAAQNSAEAPKTSGAIAICYFVGGALSSCLSVTAESN